MEVILFQLGKVLFEERKRMLLFKIQISFLNIIIIIWSALLSLYYINRLVCFAEYRMQNELYGQRYQCEAKRDTCSLAQKLIRI